MKLLIFDIDGTLTDTKQVDDACFISTFEKTYHTKLDNTDWASFENVTDLGLLRDLYFSKFGSLPNETEINRFRHLFLQNLQNALTKNPDRCKAVAGASDFIQFCAAQSTIKIAFATGGWSRTAQLKLTFANIFYDNIPFSSSDLHYRRQDILTNAIEQSKQQYQNKDFEKVIYFGDGVWDFKTTQSLKMPFIGVDIKKDNVLKNLGVKNIVDNFLNKELILNHL
jgi:phosphoglycolate phosphatase-like HAD superfamily hydrolase